MRFFVNEDCIGCGLCAGMCPDVFELKEDGKARVIVKDVEELFQEQAIDAKASCPVNAIEQE